MEEVFEATTTTLVLKASFQEDRGKLVLECQGILGILLQQEEMEVVMVTAGILRMQSSYHNITSNIPTLNQWCQSTVGTGMVLDCTWKFSLTSLEVAQSVIHVSHRQNVGQRHHSANCGRLYNKSHGQHIVT